MPDQKNDESPQDIPTNFLLMKTRKGVPWALVIVIAVVAGIAGGLLWYFVAQSP